MRVKNENGEVEYLYSGYSVKSRTIIFRPFLYVLELFLYMFSIFSDIQAYKNAKKKCKSSLGTLFALLSTGPKYLWSRGPLHWSKGNPGQVGLGSSRPGQFGLFSSTPYTGQVGRYHVGVWINCYGVCEYVDRYL